MAFVLETGSPWFQASHPGAAQTVLATQYIFKTQISDIGRRLSWDGNLAVRQPHYLLLINYNLSLQCFISVPIISLVAASDREVPFHGSLCAVVGKASFPVAPCASGHHWVAGACCWPQPAGPLVNKTARSILKLLCLFWESRENRWEGISFLWYWVLTPPPSAVFQILSGGVYGHILLLFHSNSFSTCCFPHNSIFFRAEFWPSFFCHQLVKVHSMV